MSGEKKRRRVERKWGSGEVRALRRHLNVSQDELAEALGNRQQTVSEWETGRYRPRGASARLLSIVAEQAGFEYTPQSRVEPGDEPQEEAREGAG